MRGFSLLETLVVSGVGIIAGTLLISFLVHNNGIFYQQSATISQGISINDAVSKITESIRTSSGVAVAYPVLNPQYSSDSATIVLSIPSINVSGDTIDNVFDFIVIYRDGVNQNILKKQIFPDILSSRKAENMVIATKLSSINYSYLDNSNNPVSPTNASKVSFTLSLTEKVGSVDETRTAGGLVNFRNN